MIKIDLDSTNIEGTIYKMKGSIDIDGSIETISHEMYQVAKVFEEYSREAWSMVIAMIMMDISDDYIDSEEFDYE